MPAGREERERFDFDRDIWRRPDFLSVPLRRPAEAIEPPLPPLGRWVEGQRPRRECRASGEWLSVAAYAAMLIVAALGMAYATLLSAYAPAIGPSGLLLSLLLLTVGVIILRTLDGAGDRATSDDETLLEDPEDLAVCLVEARIYQNGVLTGTDRGAAWLADGCLLFCGHRTSFVIGGEHLAKPPSETPDVVRPEFEDSLRLRHPQRAVMLSFTPLHRATDPEGKAAFRFRKELRGFRKRPPTGRVPSQYPPLALDPWVTIPKPGLFADSATGYDTRQTLLRIHAEEPNPPQAPLTQRFAARVGGSAQ